MLILISSCAVLSAVGWALYRKVRGNIFNAVQLAYLRGWNDAMALRQQWDRNCAIEAQTDAALRQPRVYNGLHLVN